VSTTAASPNSAQQPADLDAAGREHKKIAGNAAIVAVGTLASRLLGLVRDQVIAAVFARAATDAFFVAFTIPNVLRQLVAEGAVQNSVLPVLEGVRERQGDSAARGLFATLRGFSLLVLLVITLLGVIFAPQLVHLFAGGYRQIPGQFERTVTLTRWLFPYIFFMGTAALGVAALNVCRRFVVTSFAPGLLNVAFIVAGLALPAWLSRRNIDAVMALALAALAGGALQVVAQWPSLRAVGYLGWPRLALREPAFRETLRRMGPVLFGIGIYYVDVILARRFLSELDMGSQSYFSWAMRLCDFPQGIFVMALQSATLPSLSRLVARGEMDAVAKTFAFSMRLTLWITIAASIGAIALAQPLVTLIFQRGQFDSVAAEQTARAFIAQGLGIWMVAAVRQLVGVYFALGDTKTPVRVAAIDLVAFILAAMFLLPRLGHVGVGLAVTIASFVQMLLLWAGLAKRLPTLHTSIVVKSALRTIAIAVIAALAARFALRCPPIGALLSNWGRILPGLFGAVVYASVFLTISRGLKCEELSWLKFRRHSVR
jgi:putative peptidoglycan lipid II flippase